MDYYYCFLKKNIFEILIFFWINLKKVLVIKKLSFWCLLSCRSALLRSHDKLSLFHILLASRDYNFNNLHDQKWSFSYQRVELRIFRILENCVLLHLVLDFNPFLFAALSSSSMVHDHSVAEVACNYFSSYCADFFLVYFFW